VNRHSKLFENAALPQTFKKLFFSKIYF